MSELATTLLTAEDARALTDDIRRRVTDLLPLITRAYEQRADKALGYATWADYCATELSGLRVPLADRPAMVAELRQNGMSTRAIGAALGVSKDTVARELATVSDETVGQPERVVSLDGRERPAQMPARQEVADQILGAIDERVSAAAEDHSAGDARRDAELDAALAGSVQRFRLNFATARVKAYEISTFDADRLNEVHAANWDREVGDLLNTLESWINTVREGHRAQQRAGLRVVNGGRS